MLPTFGSSLFHESMQAGTIWINGWAQVSDSGEEGSFKQSGRGRLRGIAGLDDFLEYKHISLNPGISPRTLASTELPPEDCSASLVNTQHSM